MGAAIFWVDLRTALQNSHLLLWKFLFRVIREPTGHVIKLSSKYLYLYSYIYVALNLGQKSIFSCGAWLIQGFITSQTVQNKWLQCASLNDTPILMLKAQGISQEREWKEPEGRKGCGEMSSGHDISVTFMNSQKLCVPVWDLHKNQTAKNPSWKGAGLMRSQL